ncbi:MAG: carbamoyltransferase HypF [Pseudomonadota bacterium]
MLCKFFTKMADKTIQSLKITIVGQVQGVGFRPFIYRLAKASKLNGWVRNCSGEVVVLVQGVEQDLQNFKQGILEQHPPLAIPEIESIEILKQNKLSCFEIKKSALSGTAQRHIPPDYFTCDDCLTEISDPLQARYRYPFINCTQCGPRYTIIKDLPYDRPNTSMQDFPLCPRCNQEYSNTLDRRFHAQPLACAECGPNLTFEWLNEDALEEKITSNEKALAVTINFLKQGKIIAVKGIGGYHLICDATNQQAVKRLRRRKFRPDKPLAVMFSSAGKNTLQQLEHYCAPSAAEAKVLLSPQRPIVLIAIKDQPQGKKLARAINPGLNEVGCMLAYSPLHYLILNDFGLPIVATSGNISAEPVIIDNQQAATKLAKIADGFLQHNRPIVRPADDSVVRVIADKKRLLRIGRGIGPVEIKLAYSLKKPILATGGQMKNTIALGWGNRVVISPHIGELNNKPSMEVFAQLIDDFCFLYRVKPELIVCDAHPDYYSSIYAKNYAIQNNISLINVQHHKAHASILCGEYNSYKNSEQQQWLVFSWDGTGLGDDNSIWGGEGFYGEVANWQRVCSIKPFHLQGGDKAAKQPWRSACALIWEIEQESVDKQTLKNLWQPQIKNLLLVYQAWKKGINTIQCSSMGRLFDAASAMLSIADISSFEGQGPMLLEALLSQPLNSTGAMALPLYKQNNQQEMLIIADWSDLLSQLLDNTQSQQQRSIIFHQRIAETLIAQALYIRSLKGDFRVGLSGGVFQNKHLTEYILKRLKEENFAAFLPEKIPYNDAGLAFGQIIECSLM